MSKALSVDLRTRVLAAVSTGASHREAAERFGVGVASVSRWRNLQLEKGNVRPGPIGGDRSSHKTEAHADLIMAGLGGIATAHCSSCVMLCLRKVSSSASRRYTVALSGMTKHAKKTGHAVEQSHPDLLEMRQS
ncbi:helix-turn-helix domain-containing protein [Brucella sp. NF 2653]|uniref:helix-turn-helix domain-containing protein n=1 Tax=Brucella sp. NF 2653 TaxID=693748 RepID=UPI0026D78069